MDRYDSNKDEFAETLEHARALLAGECDNADALEANDMVSAALALRPESGAAWILKCQTLSSLNDDTAALSAIEMAIRFAPKSAEAHYWRSAVLSDLNRLPEALKTIDRCFRYVGSDDFWLLEDLYCEKAMILDALGREEDAVTTYEDGLRRCPSSSLLRAGLAPLRRSKARSNFKVLRGGIA